MIEQFRRMCKARKKAVTLRLDADVLACHPPRTTVSGVLRQPSRVAEEHSRVWQPKSPAFENREDRGSLS
jgi:hypothetical protein